MTKRNAWRDRHKGADLGQLLRIAAKNLYDAAERNTQQMEREASLFKYETAPCIDVVISQVQSNPPLWRMQTVGQVVGELEPMRVVEENPKLLEAELRNCIRMALDEHGYTKAAADPAAEARKWAADVKIRVVDTVLLRDNQRLEFEWNR
jgi:hypothetical protein